jgi:flagellar basal-body rod protein FlgG
MVKGIEAAAAGMIGATHLNDIIANNMANINTPGFKQTLAVFKNVQDLEVNKLDVKNNEYSHKKVGSLSAGSELYATILDFEQGNIKTTGNSLDLAISGDGFFVVRTPDGDAYTRNGSFSLRQDGVITTLEGYPLIGEKGAPLKSNTNNFNLKDLQIHPNGNFEINKETLDKVKIVDFKNYQELEPMGNSLYKPINDQIPFKSTNYEIKQGAIEGSNSNTIDSMIKSIEASRIYETLSKTVEISNKTLTKAINEVGRVKR